MVDLAPSQEIQTWVDQFHKDGCLVIPDVLPRNKCEVLIEEYKQRRRHSATRVQKRMFEDSPDNLTLFQQEPLLSFARALIGGTHNGHDKDLHPVHEISASVCNVIHVCHNSSHLVPGGGANGLVASVWHQDDTPHIFSTNGEPLPDHIQLNVLVFTVLYYLTDVDSVENGPTQFIPGSHRFGRACPPDLPDTSYKPITCLGKAGTAVCFNNQVWHRGMTNNSKRDRYSTQISYAKRLVGHKYDEFMNYQMPAHVFENADKELKELLGFLPHGSYG